MKYDFTRRVSALHRLQFTARTISDFSATWDTGEIYLPGRRRRHRAHGGRTGITISRRAAIARHWHHGVICPPAARSNPNGSIQEGSPTNLVPGSRQRHRAQHLRHPREARRCSASPPGQSIRCGSAPISCSATTTIPSRASARARCKATRSTRATTRSPGPASTPPWTSTKIATTSPGK